MTQINCPKCGQSFTIAAELMPAYQGRNIVCTRCHHEFGVSMPAAPALMPPALPQPPALPAMPNRKPRTSGWVIGLIAIAALLVLVIGAGVVTALVWKTSGQTQSAQRAKAAVDIQMISNAMELLYIDRGQYPSNDEGLNSLISRPPGANDWHGPYLRSLPVDPWGHPYVYRYPGVHNASRFDVFSVGPDGQEGGGDDIGNWATR